MMRRKIAFISSFLFLISSTELHELAKVPFFVAHFTQHCSTAPTLSLAAFISMHYFGNHPNDLDETEDKKLPFKSGNDVNHTDISLLAVKESNEILFLPYKREKKIAVEGVPCHRSIPIFHPPQLS